MDRHSRLSALVILSGLLTISCVKVYDDPLPEPEPDTGTLNCRKPDNLKPGDKVALISPSYFTPMENVEKAADLLRTWGLEPVIGPNVGKTYDGKYAGTVTERLSDIRWAFDDPSPHLPLRSPSAFSFPANERGNLLYRSIFFVSLHRF